MPIIRCTFNSTERVEKPDLPQNLLGNQRSSNPQNQTLESNPLISQLHGHATSYLPWNVIRKFPTGLGFASLHPSKSQLR